MTRTLVITSGKGGVGKTNIAVNTAIELARRHYRTCLFDADLGLANVNILLGIDPEYTLDAFLFGDKQLDQVILKTRYGIDIIPGSSGIEKTANLDREKISSLVDSLAQIRGYDFFLIDTSSGISQGVMAFCLAGNETVVVITSEATALTDAYALLKVMAHNNYCGTVKILVNKSPSIPQARETYLRFKEVVNRHLPLTIAPAGIILHDPNIEESISRQEPAISLYPESLASQCFKATVANLLKTDSTIQPDGDLGAFWQRYFEFSLAVSQEEQPQPGTGSNNFQLVLAENGSKPRSAVPPESPDAVSDHVERTAQSTTPATSCNLSSPQEMNACEISALPSPVPLLTRALELQARGELTWESLQAIICCDPALLVQALKMIGRSKGDVRRSKRVTRRDQLLQELGEKALTDLLNTACMRTALSDPSPAETVELTGDFWRHSYRCAVLAEVIAEITAYPWPEEAYIAGLIHDIGRLALQIGHPETYRQFPKTFGHLEPVITMEQQLFRRTHAEIGAATLRAWHLDGLLADAVQYHTESFTRIETAFNLVKIVSLASRLCDNQEPEGEALAAALFGFTSSQVHNLLVVTGDRVRRFSARYQLDLDQETDVNRREPASSHFRQQAMDYSIMLGVLPNTVPAGQLPETIRSIFQAFHVVFSLQPGFCLMPDRRHSLLQARGYPDCFCWESLADIQFSLHWHNSLMVTAFLSGEVQTAIAGETGNTLTLADRQLLRSLGSEGLVCVPMIAHGRSRGLIVFGIEGKQLDTIRSIGHRLAQFGAQGARNICRLERAETGHLVSGNSF